jgi:hypothetical protein
MTKKIAAIDPGICTGCAIFSGAALVKCGEIEDLWDAAKQAEIAVIERPVIYPFGKQKARPRDIITLALKAGYIAGRLFPVPVRYVEPAEWKRQLPKEICHQRIAGILRKEELSIMNALKLPQSKLHNCWDAVGIGMWYLGRKVV